jgi:hypothetical protein
MDFYVNTDGHVWSWNVRADDDVRYLLYDSFYYDMFMRILQRKRA